MIGSEELGLLCCPAYSRPNNAIVQGVLQPWMKSCPGDGRTNIVSADPV